MTDRTELADRLKTVLHLALDPVGVRIFKRGEDVSPVVRPVESQPVLKAYCQGLIRAGRGETFLGAAAQLGCSLGTVTLGLEDDPAPLLHDTVREKLGAGLFSSEDASRSSVAGAPKFEKGANQSVLIGPLGALPVEPHVVILELDPEQTMWLLYAANYRRGGPQQFPQSGGVAGGCADVTVVPFLTGGLNITFLGLGCRLKSGIPHSHLLAGFPWAAAPEIVGHLETMAKPIAKLRAARLPD